MKAFLLLTFLTNLVFANPDFSIYSFTHPMEMEETMKFISKTNPKLAEEVKQEVATSILKVSQKHNLDHKLMLSIIAVESSFKPAAKSTTGDFSIVQINYATWSVEFKRIQGKVLNFQKLKKDIPYSIESMGEILSYLKRYQVKDSLWFARYHSKTPSLKRIYAKRIFSKNLTIVALY